MSPEDCLHGVAPMPPIQSSLTGAHSVRLEAVQQHEM